MSTRGTATAAVRIRARVSRWPVWRQRLSTVFSYLLSLVWLVVAFLPIAFMALTAFKTIREFLIGPWGLPARWSMANFSSVWQSNFPVYLTNSLIVTGISVLLIVAFSSLAAYAFARMNFPGHRPLFLLILAGMMIPIHITLIPIYIMTQWMGTYDSIFALIGPYVGFALPISVFILTEFFSQIPKELETRPASTAARPSRSSTGSPCPGGARPGHRGHLQHDRHLERVHLRLSPAPVAGHVHPSLGPAPALRPVRHRHPGRDGRRGHGEPAHHPPLRALPGEGGERPYPRAPSAPSRSACPPALFPNARRR